MSFEKQGRGLQKREGPSCRHVKVSGIGNRCNEAAPTSRQALFAITTWSRDEISSGCPCGLPLKWNQEIVCFPPGSCAMRQMFERFAQRHQQVGGRRLAAPTHHQRTPTQATAMQRRCVARSGLEKTLETARQNGGSAMARGGTCRYHSDMGGGRAVEALLFSLCVFLTAEGGFHTTWH